MKLPFMLVWVAFTGVAVTSYGDDLHECEKDSIAYYKAVMTWKSIEEGRMNTNPYLCENDLKGLEVHFQKLKAPEGRCTQVEALAYLKALGLESKKTLGYEGTFPEPRQNETATQILHRLKAHTLRMIRAKCQHISKGLRQTDGNLQNFSKLPPIESVKLE